MNRWLFSIPVALLLVGQSYAEGARLTIYNQEFAVVRETIPLELNPGMTKVSVSEITAHVEPDSVILRDPRARQRFRIVEQNYRSDPISQALLLSLYEGQTIDFLINANTGETVSGRIVRSGYVTHNRALSRFGQAYWQRQNAYAYGQQGLNQPLIEVDGKLRFQLPGTPLFPSLEDDVILKPTLDWLIESERGGEIEAELSYVTGGMIWAADYNLMSNENSDEMELVGWVTLENQSGRTFEDAQVKLIAGDVNKLQSREDALYRARSAGASARGGFGGAARVTEKSLDDYHLYTLARRTTVRDRESKQVEFIRAAGIESERFYVYDGAKIDWNRYRGRNTDSIRNDPGFGTESNPKVWIILAFENSEENNLGIPLPKGRLRFYTRSEGQLEFTGENVIDHTPKDETVRAYIGNAFDITGSRKRTVYDIDHSRRWIKESFAIELHNHKEEAVEVRVVEHLYRWHSWVVESSSIPFEKQDSDTIEFRVGLEPDQELELSYTVEYTW